LQIGACSSHMGLIREDDGRQSYEQDYNSKDTIFTQHKTISLLP